MRSLRFLLLAGAVLGVASCGKDNSGPTQPIMTTTTPAVRTATATPPTAMTPTPPAATPTPPPAAHAVNIGQGGANRFTDSQSGTSTTTIRAGESVTWTWVSGFHSTTSGACCTGDGNWDSGPMSGGSFTHAFPSTGSFPYFCRVHQAMMTGMVVVNP